VVYDLIRIILYLFPCGLTLNVEIVMCRYRQSIFIDLHAIVQMACSGVYRDIVSGGLKTHAAARGK